MAGLVLGMFAVVTTLGGQVLAEGALNPGILLALVGLLCFSAGGSTSSGSAVRSIRGPAGRCSRQPPAPRSA
ncbi:hypothetical protein [Saccharopolyspora sp. NPDC002376]